MQIPVCLFSMPSGETLTLRSTHPDDAASLLCHQQITSGETDFMARYPEECTGTLAAMQERLHLLEQHPCSFTVTAFCGDRVVGDLMVTPVRPHIKYLHRAQLGMAIQRAYWGAGLGRRMLTLAILQARKNGFEQLELGVFSDNTRAIHLYESCGFHAWGTQPRAFKLKDGTYRDEIMMVRFFDESACKKEERT